MGGHSLANELHLKAGMSVNDLLPIMRSNAKRGDAEQASTLGRVFQTGMGGIARDDAEAFRYTLAAAEGGARRRCLHVALCVSDMRRRVARNDAEACHYMLSVVDCGVRCHRLHADGALCFKF